MPPIDLPGVTQIVSTGKTYTLTSTTATAPTLVPLDANGANPKLIRAMATNTCFIRFGQATNATATANDIMLTGNHDPQIFNVKGQPYFSAILMTTANAATTILNLAAVEL